jgi:hypothetical protein
MASRHRAAPHRTRTEREGHYAEISRLDRRGWTQQQIADELGISRAQVGFDLVKIRKRYLEMANLHAGEKIGEQLAAFRDLRKEAWEAWDASWRERVTVTVRPGSSDDPFGDVVTTTRRESRVPDAAFLGVIRDTFAAEAKLLGLNQESPAVFLSTDNVVEMMNTLMLVVSRHVQDPRLVQQMKMEVLAMLPGAVELPAETPTISEVSPTGDAEPPEQHREAADAEPEPHVNGVLNGVHRGGDDNPYGFEPYEPV